MLTIFAHFCLLLQPTTWMVDQTLPPTRVLNDAAICEPVPELLQTVRCRGEAGAAVQIGSARAARNQTDLYVDKERN